MIQILNIFFGVLLSVLEAITEGIAKIAVNASPLRRNQQYNGDFIPAEKLLFEYEKGFCLTGSKSLSIKSSYSNCLVLGGSGSGKSSRVLIPSILKMAGTSSLVIHDPSGELFEKTSGSLAQSGYDIKVLNYSAPQFSEGYNPLHRAKSISDIQKISKLIVQTSLGQGKDPFWNTSAESLISLFAQYLIHHAPLQYRTLNNVFQLVNAFGSSGEKVDKLIVRANDNVLLANYKAFVAYDSKMLMSIVATARASLLIFSDPTVAQITSTDTLDFENFRQQKTILYINNSVSDMNYYSVISSIFFEQFFAQIMYRLPSKDELPVFFLLDEASSLHLNILPTAISNIRKYNSGILQVYQHYDQLVDLYQQSQARNIAANCYAKVYMSGQSIETAKELETMLGKFDFVDIAGIVRTKQLMPADVIRQLEESIILCGNSAPIKAKMIPYFEQKDLRTQAEIPAYQLKNIRLHEAPSLIPLCE